MRDTTPSRSPTPILPAGWILVCAFWNCVGWALSICHALTPTGYAIACAVGVLALAAGQRWAGPLWARWPSWPKLCRRFRRPAALGFLVLASLAVLGGALYAPNNYDALAYRTPRVLHWLAEGRWHWIHTEFHRLNVRGCGMEWVTAPFLALTHSDRGLFLITVASFLVLPGRVFSLLIRLGVRPRVAWHWMWVLPNGYCFLLQAGSISNDLFGTTLVLLAIEFALRARASQRWSEAALSVLAAALMTATKSFNLLMLLPWAIALAGPSGRWEQDNRLKAASWWQNAWREFWHASGLTPLLGRRWALVPLAVVAVGASLLPTCWLNARYCGDWTGIKAENPANLGHPSTVLRVGVNSAWWTLSNLKPPVFPCAKAWNHWMDRVIPAGLERQMQQQFEVSEAHFYLEEMESEETAGLGFGVSVLLLVWAACRFRRWRAGGGRLPGRPRLGLETLVLLGMVIALLVFIIQLGLSGSPRYLGQYYILLAVPLLAGSAASGLVPSGGRPVGRWHWFELGCLAVYGLALLPMVLSPARPLWPAQTVLHWLGGKDSPHPFVRRAATVYEVYAHRHEAFAPALAVLPPEANPLGVTTSDDPEAALWRPYGSRRVLHLCAEDTPADIRREGIRYALLSAMMLERRHRTLEQWLAEQDAELVQRLDLQLFASEAPTKWYVVRLR